MPVDTHGKFAYQTSAISVFGLTLFQQERFIIQTMALDVAVYVHTLMDDEHVQLVSQLLLWDVLSMHSPLH
jgi:hypothetical protein